MTHAETFRPQIYRDVDEATKLPPSRIRHIFSPSYYDGHHRVWEQIKNFAPLDYAFEVGGAVIVEPLKTSADQKGREIEERSVVFNGLPVPVNPDEQVTYLEEFLNTHGIDPKSMVVTVLAQKNLLDRATYPKQHEPEVKIIFQSSTNRDNVIIITRQETGLEIDMPPYTEEVRRSLPTKGIYICAEYLEDLRNGRSKFRY